MQIQAASTHIHISIFLMHIQLQTTNWVSRTTAAAAATARQTDHAQNSFIHCSKEALWNSFIHVRSKTRSSPAEKKLRRPISPPPPQKKKKTKKNHPKHKTKKKKQHSIHDNSCYCYC
jgi:RNA processing factor Prp31